MAKLRKFCAYRRLERPYTRHSKYRALSFVRSKPSSKVVRYSHGNPNKDYTYTINLRSKQRMQIRHNAIESARLTANRQLEKKAGKGNYHFKIRIYPHHFLRENPLAAGAGADRMSTGMKMAFGKIVGSAAQVDEDQIIATIEVTKPHLEFGRTAAQRMNYKLPVKTRIEVVDNSKKNI
jgi:large subunit ribosomal protein L10e